MGHSHAASRGPNAGDARAARVIARAQAFKDASEPELRAFLRGLQAAELACRDLVDEQYEAADRAAGVERIEGNARAAGRKDCAERIGALYDAACRATQQRRHRRGLRTLLGLLSGLGGQHA